MALSGLSQLTKLSDRRRGRSELELRPYVDVAREQKEKEQRKIQPLQFIFDILSTGQYVTANATEDFFKAIQEGRDPGEATKRALVGAMEGLTWKRKGDWEKVLFGNIDDPDGQQAEEEFRGIWGDAEIPKWAKRVVGFAANVALDPTTYIGGFGVKTGATKAARGAAKAFADDTIKVVSKRLGSSLDEMAKIGRVGATFSQEAFHKLVQEDGEKALSYVAKHGGDDMRRFFSQTYDEAFKHALQTPPDKLRKEMAGEIETVLSRVQERWIHPEAEGLAGLAATRPATNFTGFAPPARMELPPGATPPRIQLPELGDRGFENALPPPVKPPGPPALGLPTPPPVTPTKFMGLNDILNALPEKYGGAGQRSWRFMGKEMNPSVRPANVAARSIDEMSNLIKRFRVPGRKETLGDVWWSVNHKGPLGMLRKAFGVRNPYEQMVRMYELDGQKQFFEEHVGHELAQYHKLMDGYDDETKQALEAVVSAAEEMTKYKPTTPYDVIDQYLNKKVIGGPDIQSTVNPETLKEAVGKVQVLTKRLLAERRSWQADGFMQAPDELFNFIPTFQKDLKGPFPTGIKPSAGGFSAQTAKPRTYTRVESEAQQISKWAWILGIDIDDARKVVIDHNLSSYSTNLDELMTAYLVGHSRMASKVNMVKKFREIGVPMDMFSEAGFTGEALMRHGGELEQLGLQQVQEPALSGYLFDRETAEIFNRAVQITSDEASRGFMRAWDGYTAWWKGVVTLSSGFNARNWISNNVTGFLKFGPRWFEIKKYGMPAMAASLYALGRDNPEAILKNVGMSDGMWKRLLATRGPGGKTYKEWGDYALKHGVVSENLMGYDIPDTVSKWAGKGPDFNPFSTKFAPVDINRKIGSIVESSSRMQSFLMDLTDATASGGSVDEAAEFATMEAKKWFLDYGDLSEFERSTLRRVIPFYSWLRKNIANQVAGITMYPEMFSVFPKLEAAVSQENPEYDPDLLPPWMKQLGMKPVGMTEAKKAMMWWPNLPYEDINRIPLSLQEGQVIPSLDWEEVRTDLISAANPIIKTLAEVVIPKKGYDIFYQEELADKRKAPYLMHFLAKSPQTLALIDGMLNVGGFGGLKAEYRDGKFMIDSKAAKILENNLPLLKSFEHVGVAANALIPGFEAWTEQTAGVKDYYEGMEQLFQFLSRWAGVKFRELDLEKAKDEYNEDILRRAEEMKRKDYGVSRQAEIRKMRSRDTRREKARRLVGR